MEGADTREGRVDAREGRCACPYEHAQQILGGKWSLVILKMLLDNGSLRFNHLQRPLGPVAPGTLTKHLKALEAAGLIARHSFDTVPPRVEYALTPIGLELRPLMAEFERWSQKYAAYVHAA